MICRRCTKDKEIKDFPNRESDYICFQCIREQYDYEKFRRAYLPRAYGITLEEYDALVKNQNGRCSICGNVPKRWLVVDHCHGTGTIRGLLCDDCNVGLGKFNDNPDLMQRAIEYLKIKRDVPSLTSVLLQISTSKSHVKNNRKFPSRNKRY